MTTGLPVVVERVLVEKVVLRIAGLVQAPLFVEERPTVVVAVVSFFFETLAEFRVGTPVRSVAVGSV